MDNPASRSTTPARAAAPAAAIRPTGRASPSRRTRRSTSIPAKFVNERLSGMRCEGDRCSALSGKIGRDNVVPDLRHAARGVPHLHARRCRMRDGAEAARVAGAVVIASVMWSGSPDEANGSRECAPDDRLRAIRELQQSARESRVTLALTPGLRAAFAGTTERGRRRVTPSQLARDLRRQAHPRSA